MDEADRILNMDFEQEVIIWLLIIWLIYYIIWSELYSLYWFVSFSSFKISVNWRPVQPRKTDVVNYLPTYFMAAPEYW